MELFELTVHDWLELESYQLKYASAQYAITTARLKQGVLRRIRCILSIKAVILLRRNRIRSSTRIERTENVISGKAQKDGYIFTALDVLKFLVLFLNLFTEIHCFKPLSRYRIKYCIIYFFFGKQCLLTSRSLKFVLSFLHLQGASHPANSKPSELCQKNMCPIFLNSIQRVLCTLEFGLSSASVFQLNLALRA